MITAARLHAEQRERVPHRVAFITLTYRDVNGWGPLDITEYQRALRGWAKERGYSIGYVWVAELQKRGAVHYHAIVWWQRADHQPGRLVNLPMPDRSGMWPHGSSRIETPRNPVGYLAKYTSKGSDDLTLPAGLRICGHGGLGAAQRLELGWWSAPAWVRRFIPLDEGAKRLRCGWWGNRATRYAYRSPWRFDAQTLRTSWAGWEWWDVCLTGAAYEELSGSG